MSNIKCFKLTTGEEIIADQVASVHDYYRLAKPRVLVAQQTGPRTVGVVAMVPWMFCDPDGQHRLYKQFVIGEPHQSLPKDLEDGYLKETSGIEIAASIQGAPPQRP